MSVPLFFCARQSAEKEREQQRVRALEQELNEEQASRAKEREAAASQQRESERLISELKAGQKRDAQSIKDKDAQIAALRAQVAGLEQDLTEAGERERQLTEQMRRRDALAHSVAAKRMAGLVLRGWQHAVAVAKAREEDIERGCRREAGACAGGGSTCLRLASCATVLAACLTRTLPHSLLRAPPSTPNLHPTLHATTSQQVSLCVCHFFSNQYLPVMY